MSLQPSPQLRRSLVLLIAFLSAISLRAAYGQATSSAPPTFTTTSRLVYFDVTVLDRKGHPVVTGLTKDDFTITDNKRKQWIVSFEGAEAPRVRSQSIADMSSTGAPTTIFVLDLLNSNFEDFAYIRYEVRKYLASQPYRLNSPLELMILGNLSLKTAQNFTRNKADLLHALDHVPTALPYKKMLGDFWLERVAQSLDALQQIALQNKGIPGRKNIIWVGHGPPNFITAIFPERAVAKLNGHLHETTNMLVDSRITLFVIYPGLPVANSGFSVSQMLSGVDLGDGDPFSEDVNFGVFVNETGGKLFFNRNDIDREIKQSEELGSQYYTLTYHPQLDNLDGSFRRVRVTVRDPNLRVLTKTGYFAPDETHPADSQRKMTTNIAEAVRSTIPFTALHFTLENLVRHPDTESVEYSVVLKSAELGWQSADDGSTTHVSVAAASLDRNGRILASKAEDVKLSANSQDPRRLPETLRVVRMTLRTPAKTKDVRVVITQDWQEGRLGALDLTSKELAAAPEAPTPKRKLIPRPPS